jgi:hypothetical protein
MAYQNEPHKLRKPCTKCGSADGQITTSGGQDCVYCIGCGKYQYNAPKTETGRKPRTVQSIHSAISASQRARILVNANGLCELCGQPPTREHPLHVGHILSVKEGLDGGSTVQLLNSDDNCAAMCDACNLGIGKMVLPIKLLVRILVARFKQDAPSES